MSHKDFPGEEICESVASATVVSSIFHLPDDRASEEEHVPQIPPRGVPLDVPEPRSGGD